MGWKQLPAALPLAGAILVSGCGHIGVPSPVTQTSTSVRSGPSRSASQGVSVQAYGAGTFSDANPIRISGNMAQYPSGKYWGGEQILIVGGGGNSTFPDDQMAAAFTPAANHTATTIEVAALSAELQGYGNAGFTLNLNQDHNGVPGATLLSAQIPALPPGLPLCCSLVVGKDPSGIALTGGQQYWVVISGKKGQSTDAAVWAENATDQLHPQLNAVYCAYVSHCPNGAGWYPFTSNLGFGTGLAFAVLGNK